jgi:hypothetical protein
MPSYHHFQSPRSVTRQLEVMMLDVGVISVMEGVCAVAVVARGQRRLDLDII